MMGPYYHYWSGHMLTVRNAPLDIKGGGFTTIGNSQFGQLVPKSKKKFQIEVEKNSDGVFFWQVVCVYPNGQRERMGGDTTLDERNIIPQVRAKLWDDYGVRISLASKKTTYEYEEF